MVYNLLYLFLLCLQEVDIDFKVLKSFSELVFEVNLLWKSLLLDFWKSFQTLLVIYNLWVIPFIMFLIIVLLIVVFWNEVANLEFLPGIVVIEIDLVIIQANNRIFFFFTIEFLKTVFVICIMVFGYFRIILWETTTIKFITRTHFFMLNHFGPLLISINKFCYSDLMNFVSLYSKRCHFSILINEILFNLQNFIFIHDKNRALTLSLSRGISSSLI